MRERTMATGWRLLITAMLALGFSDAAGAECFQMPGGGFLVFKYVNGDLGIGQQLNSQVWIIKTSCPTKDSKTIDWPKDGLLCPGVTTIKVDGRECKVEGVTPKK